MAKIMWSLGIAVAIAVASGCVEEVVDAEVDAVEDAGIDGRGFELIGISGRRLGDGESYRVPLDSERVVAVGATVREALVLVNRGPRDVLVEGLAVIDEMGDAGDVGEWRLVAPTRAREIPLAAVGILLHPDARLDFDVALTGRDGGVRQAWLELAWREDDRYETRRVLLWASVVADGSSPTGPDPPQ